MEAMPKDCWYFMVLTILLSVLKDAFLEKPADSVRRLQHGGLTLSCLCPWSGNLTQIAWVKMPEKKQVAVFHPDLGVAIPEEYEGRVEFLRSSLMDGSVSIRNVTARDAGLYQCSVQTFPKGSWTKTILVEESGTRDSVDLSLGAAVPKVVKKGETFVLRCDFVDGGLVYRVTLEKVGDEGVDTVALCSRLEGGRAEESFLGADFRERATVNCSDLGVSMRLANVTEEDGGLYHCHVHAEAFARTSTVSLTVPGEEGAINPTREIYVYVYMYVGGGVSGLVLIAVVTASICWHKRKKRRERVRAKLHPMQRLLLNDYQQAALYDRMKSRAEHQEESQVYANVPTWPHRGTRRT